MKVRNPLWGILFAGIFLVVGVFVFLWGLASSRSAYISQKWPSEVGAVTSSEIGTSRSSKGSTTYSAKIRYQYQVNGQTYTGNKVSFVDISTSNSSDAQKIIARYKKGQAVRVYYNPNDPGDAVLETGFTLGLLLPLGIGAIFSLVGGALLINLVVGYLRHEGSEVDTGVMTN